MCSRGHWRPAEDDKLRELVDRYGPHNWNAIAQKLQGRSGTLFLILTYLASYTYVPHTVIELNMHFLEKIN